MGILIDTEWGTTSRRKKKRHRRQVFSHAALEGEMPTELKPKWRKTGTDKGQRKIMKKSYRTR